MKNKRIVNESVDHQPASVAEKRFESPLRQLLDRHPELARIYGEHSGASNIIVNDAGEIVNDGHAYHDNPRIRGLVELADAIRNSLPPVQDGYVRLWRGNRPNEVGHNPSYTNSLVGIALPFLRSYGGVLSYVDVPKGEVGKFLVLVGGAKDSEFILPKELVETASIVGFTPEEADKIRTAAKPLPEIDSEAREVDGWGWGRV